jgi:PEP-CTERM motif
MIRSMYTRMALSAAALALTAGLASAAPVIIQPADGKDTQLVDSAGQSGTNYGSSQFVMDNWAGNFRAVALVEFDLSAYAGGSVSSAALGLFHMFNTANGTTYNVYRVTSAWDENSATFDTAPTIDSVAVATLTIGDNGTDVYREWDITATVNGWLSNSFGNFGLWIEEVPIAGDGVAYFASSDNANGNGPRLTLNTNTVPEPGTMLLVAAAALGAGLSRRR